MMSGKLETIIEKYEMPLIGVIEGRKLRERKEAVLSELEAAHLLIYQQRAERVIRSNLESQKERKKSKNYEVKNKYEIYSHTDIINSNIEIINEKYSSKNLFELEPPKVDTKDIEIKTMALRLAQNAVIQDERLKSFRRSVDGLETKGKIEDLEAILDAVHNVSVMASYSAQDFLITFEAIPLQDQVVYSNVTSKLFRDQIGEGEYPLSSRLQMILPKPFSQKLHLFGDEENDDFNLIKRDKIFFEKNTSEINSFTDKYNIISACENDYFKPIRSSEEISLEIENDFRTSSLTELMLMHDLQDGFLNFGMSSRFFDMKMDTKNNWNINGDFFGEVQEIYRQLDLKIGGEWLREADTLFEEDYDKGRDFVLKSRPTLIEYRNSLDWDFETFVKDYKEFGNRLRVVGAFTGKYCQLSKERKQSLVRQYLDSKDVIILESLVKNDLPKEMVGVVAERLPDHIDNSLLVQTFWQVSDIYKQCIAANIKYSIVDRKIKSIEKADSLSQYFSALNETKKLVSEYIEFADEQRRDPNMNLGFNDTKSQETLEVYQDVLGKNFAQFRRDFEATGTDFQKIPEIAKTYGEFLGEDKLRAVLNYVTKQRNRNLINDLITPAPNKLIQTTLEKLGDSGKEDTVKALRELNKTWDFLNEVGANQILIERLGSLNESNEGKDVIDAIAGSRRQCYFSVTGDNEVPTGLEQMVDNVVVGYYKRTGISNGVDIQPALKLITSTYLQEGAQATFEKIREIEENKHLRTKLKREGIDIDAFERGISRTYHVATDENSLNRVRERINSEVEQVWDRLGQLYKQDENNEEIDEEELEKQNQLKEKLEELKKGSLRDQLDNAENFISDYEFDDDTKPLKLEVKGHIQTARSLTGTLKEMNTDATFYVSNDPLESLHMGQYFGSCLSLSKNHGGANGWASVVQTMDSNKNVIYARTQDGKYVGRNRTALTDNGILCTRFYQNGDMNLNNSWVDYLQGFADSVKQDVMIPTLFTQNSMSNILEKMLAEGEVSKENRSVNIAPAFYSAFYGDGLAVRKTEDGSIQVDAEVYVIKPKVSPQESIYTNIEQNESKGYIHQLASGIYRFIFGK